MPSVMNNQKSGRALRGRRGRPMSEINVTPFVDVMLVLLIVFMVTAPLLTVGVPVDLPQTRAKSLGEDREPLAVSIDKGGTLEIGQDLELGEAFERPETERDLSRHEPLSGVPF